MVVVLVFDGLGLVTLGGVLVGGLVALVGGLVLIVVGFALSVPVLSLLALVSAAILSWVCSMFSSTGLTSLF